MPSRPKTSSSPRKTRAHPPASAAAPALPEQAAESSAAPLFHWLEERSAGLLLHPTCLPGPHGIGTFDENAVALLDFLQAAGFRHWQLCPLGPTGYGDSPYQCFSAFAGNPLLIDLAALARHGLLTATELAPLTALPATRADYGALFRLKWPLLFTAHRRYLEQRPALPYGDFGEFKRQHAAWLEPYVYFRALKDHFHGAAWPSWPAALRRYTSALASPLRRELAGAADAHAFTQYLFFGQWAAVRAAARERDLTLIGDLPIFVAGDSADAWSAPHLFELDPRNFRPLAVAGVPPDYFSADGQLWGNPLYRWADHAAHDYAWWLARLRSVFALYDIVRIDHFRGFDTYWRVPWPAGNARGGKWRPGPGLEFFRAVHRAFPEARIIAEDLGEHSPSVTQLLAATGLPGMAVLQFAFGGDARNPHLPHNHTPNSVVYPGTHDNDTTAGWYRGAGPEVRDHVNRYLRVNGSEIPWDFIRAAYASPARLAVVTLPDLLSLDSSARFNTPAEPAGNWQWRFTREQLASLGGRTTAYLRDLATLYGR